MPDNPLSRRSVLQGAAVLGVTAATVGRGPLAAAAPDPGGTPDGPLVLDYRPSRPTGWPRTGGRSFAWTLGGHIPAQDFAFGGRDYRISVLDLDGRLQPRYEPVPRHPSVDFERTLHAAFGEYYAFRPVGGFGGAGELVVQSYGVFADEATADRPDTRWGGGVYLAYVPDRRAGDPPISDRVQWIQVIRREEAGRPVDIRVDSADRANPYYIYGGLTSVDGRAVLNFHDLPQRGAMLGPGAPAGDPLRERLVAETFLVRDTGRRDHLGRTLVDVYGGIAYGWEVTEVSQPSS